ncbi:15207_t:CDS:2 [Entrophospora sp. SA101]|nr:1127_t:CDS:2 [Entrophospora sp. SA101]CAJ0887356.1 15207_t:CDS:2 [Entrophospora sp. SA101]
MQIVTALRVSGCPMLALHVLLLGSHTSPVSQSPFFEQLRTDKCAQTVNKYQDINLQKKIFCEFAKKLFSACI